MCGIAGLIQWQGQVEATPEHLREVAESMRHRGPDAAGFYLDPHVALVHTRLAIVDLDHGLQPFSQEGRSEVLIFNGEIFNAPALRQRLMQRGVQLSSHSDTEVLFHLLCLDGAEAIPQLNGFFAFCFYQPEQQRCLLARDPMGEKPLYWSQLQGQSATQGDNDSACGGYAFASEVKTLVCARRQAAQLDPLQLQAVMELWSPLPDASAFQGVQQCPAGHMLEITPDGMRLTAYHQWPQIDPKSKIDADEVKALMAQATEHRLLADVPVGVMLSGGLDSAVVAQELKDLKGDNGAGFNTYSVAFADAAFDERQQQQLMAQHLGSQHHSLEVTPQHLLENLEQAVWHGESASPRLAFVAMYCLHREIHRSGTKVVLTGEGADEVFLGYDIFREALIRQQISAGAGYDDVQKDIANVNAFLPNDPKYHSFIRLKYANYQALGDSEEYLASHHQRLSLAAGAKQLLPQLATHSAREKWLQYWQQQGSGFTEQSLLRRSQLLELTTLLGGHLLSVQGDRMAMAHGVETRPPFMDKDLMQRLMALPSEQLLKLRQSEKHLLKQAYAEGLPQAIIERQKFPFRAPDSFALTQNKTGWDFLYSLPSDADPILDPSQCTALLDKLYQGAKISPRANHALVIMVTTILLQRSFKLRSLQTYTSQAQIVATKAVGQGQLYQLAHWHKSA